MNGILLFGLPEILWQVIYAALGVVGLLVFIKKVYPQYKAAFSE